MILEKFFNGNIFIIFFILIIIFLYLNKPNNKNTIKQNDKNNENNILKSKIEKEKMLLEQINIRIEEIKNKNQELKFAIINDFDEENKNNIEIRKNNLEIKKLSLKTYEIKENILKFEKELGNEK